jgi:sugar/nucleoside kinase (ribokinase family)
VAPGPRLLVLDTVMVDVTVRVPRLPERGGDVRAHDGLVAAGGGLNVAVAAKGHGLSPTYVGRLGTGPFAQVARRALADAGVEVVSAGDDGSDLGFCLVVVDDAGERTFITATGAELTLGAADLAAAHAERGDLVFLSGYDLVYSEIADVVREWVVALPAGVVVAFDPGPRVGDIDGATLDQVLARCDWLLCNEVEAARLSGGASDPSALVDRVGGGGVVVHEGERGATVSVLGSAPRHVAAFATAVVDTNGAGDTHDGVFLAEWARTGDPYQALRRANAAAAIAISRLGSAVCPARDEVEAWFAAMGEAAT